MSLGRALSDAEIVDAMESNPSYQERREQKACSRCGHIRKVVVHFLLKRSAESEHRWEKLCAACQATQRAEHYEEVAKRWRARAHELRGRQAMAVQRRVIGKAR